MADAVTVSKWLQEASRRLLETGVSSPDLDARILLGEAMGLTSAELISGSRSPIRADSLASADQMLDSRISGVPVHRILGRREFYGREFQLSRETLIPRPDTEILIDYIVSKYASRYDPIRILDIGTGSGILAVTLAIELPAAMVVASDVSQDCLGTALQNAMRLGVSDRVSFVHSDLFARVCGKYDLIVSNPPYVPAAEIPRLQKEVRCHDPIRALDGGEDGLDFYRSIFARAAEYLTDQAMICVEVGINQHQEVCSIGVENHFTVVDVLSDFSGTERVVALKMRRARQK